MRNLHVLRRLSATIDLPGCSITHAALDSENQIVFVTTDSNQLFGYAILTGAVRNSPWTRFCENTQI